MAQVEGVSASLMNWADNFQWLSRTASQVPVAFSCLERFCSHWDMQLKPSACWTWSSGPGAAGKIAKTEAPYTAANGTVVPHKGHACELGAH